MHRVRSCDYAIMDCITANRKGPTLPVGGISYLPTMDQKTDFIIAGAMMASLDPVALDTVEAALAGYELSSIPILAAAEQNGLGQSDPANIKIEGNSGFSLHRQFLWQLYNRDCQNRYPLEDGWGGARALRSVEPKYTVEASPPNEVADNIYVIDYCVKQTQSRFSRRIVRVELVVSGTVAAFEAGACIERGSFELDLNQHQGLVGTDLTYNVLAWDDTFNCVASIERFIFGVAL